MKIALVLPDLPLQSLKSVARDLVDVLKARHDVHFLPVDYAVRTPDEQEAIAQELLNEVDVLVGFIGCLEPLLRARERVAHKPPCVMFLLGTCPRGAVWLRLLLPYLTTRDRLVANCSADVELTHKYIANAVVELVPFAYDENTYRVLSSEDRVAIRSQLGFGTDSVLLLYAGRLTLEKNAHALLRIFAGVSALVPDSHLLLAGAIQDTPRSECGAMTLHYGRSLLKAASALGLTRVHFLGAQEADVLCSLYNAADVALNMTLHHDENFGLGQVEALACGTPVVGTRWGGLKDTIQDGVNGTHVSTIPTSVGVKSHWWEGVRKTSELLLTRDTSWSDRGRIAGTARRFSSACFRDAVEQLVHRTTAQSAGAGLPLRATSFADRFWSTCVRTGTRQPLYEPDHPSFEMYREMIGHYAGLSEGAVAQELPVSCHDTFVLSTPVTYGGASDLVIDDPLYPFRVTIPETCRATVGAVVNRFAVSASSDVAGFHTAAGCSRDEILETLTWMLSLGLVLRVSRTPALVDMSAIDSRMNRVVYHTMAMREEPDVLLFSQGDR